MGMTNPYLSFVKGRFAAVVIGVLFSLVWFTVLKTPVLGTVPVVMGPPVLEGEPIPASGLFRFASGVLTFAALPVTSYLAWISMMGPAKSGRRGAAPVFLALVAGVVSLAFFAVEWLANSFGDYSPRSAYRDAAGAVLEQGGRFVGDAVFGALVTAAILLLAGFVCLLLAPPSRSEKALEHPRAWWRWLAAPAVVIGILSGAAPYLG